MNFMKTAMLLAALTALFGVVGYLLGGANGMLIALGIAVVTNLFAYWNSDKLALSAHAAVAATTGLMEMLTYEELAGVMAHELAHIKNRDTLIMTVSATIAGAISTIAQFGFLFGGRDGERPNPLVMLATAILAPLAAMIIQMAISRSREYVADRMGAEICGNPLWLASSLAKLEAGVAHIHNPDAERHPATAHMFIVNPLSGHGMDNLFSTHPATENRIAALQELAAALGGGLGPARSSGGFLPGARTSPWGVGRPRRGP